MTIQLEPVELWELRALAAEAQLQARVTLEARQLQEACLARLAVKYEFDPKNKNLSLDDKTFTLTLKD
jgi:hypothetical protein